MEWVKTTAKTLPEAIDLALDNLGVDEAEAEIKVLEEPKHGIFGRLKGTARVEARVKPKPIRPKSPSSRSNRGNSGGRNRNDRNDSNSNRNRGGRDKNRDNQQRSNRNESNSGQSRGNSGGRDSNRGRSTRNNDRPKRSNRDSSSASGATDRSENQHNDKESKVRNEHTHEEVSSHLVEFLDGLGSAFGFEDAKTVITETEGALEANLEGQHGLLVGPKGRTLDAVQELSRVSAQCRVPSEIRIRVDVGGYRLQRREALAGFAAKAAIKAIDSGVEVTLEPMSAADRKVVHDALVENEGVETHSVGREPRRRIIVMPAE